MMGNNPSVAPPEPGRVTVHIKTSEPDILKAALWYAQHGYYVFPVHRPIFDHTGRCIGCTCEHSKRSNEYRQYLANQGREHEYDPHYKCPQPGKCPAVKWRDKSTVNPEQIQKWWQNPWRAGQVRFTPNIGIDCGKSRLLVLDMDTYKEYADQSLLIPDDQQTVTSLSGGGGEHLYFARGQAEFGNATGNLPAGIDIRGVGGCIIAPPSLHQSGHRYQWEDNYGPHQCALKPIPEKLRAILELAHQQKLKRASEIIITFAQVSAEAPDLTQWDLAQAVLDMIQYPSPKGQRSEHDMRVVIALCAAGVTNDEILAIFKHYPIGQLGKFVEKGSYGKQYLAITITKARAYLAEQERKLQETLTAITALRLWIRIQSFAPYIPKERRRLIYRTDSTDTKVADAVCDLFAQRKALTIRTGKKTLARGAGVSPNTVVAALHRLQDWLFMVTSSSEGLAITLCPEFVSRTLTPITHHHTVNGGQSTPSEIDSLNEYSPRKATDPFLTGISRTVKRLCREASAVVGNTPKEWLAMIPAGLGEACLRVLDALHRCGEQTAIELSNATGKTLGAIRRASRRLEDVNLVESYRAHSRAPKVYYLVPNVWEQVEVLTPTLRTYLLSAERADQQLRDSQRWVLTQRAIALKRGDQSHATKLDKQLCRLGNQRLRYLRLIYADRKFTPADFARLAYDVQLPRMPHPSLLTKLRRYHAHARLHVMEIQRVARQDLINQASDLRQNGTSKRHAARMLHLAGYTQREVWQAIHAVWSMREYPMPDP